MKWILCFIRQWYEIKYNDLTNIEAALSETVIDGQLGKLEIIKRCFEGVYTSCVTPSHLFTSLHHI